MLLYLKCFLTSFPAPGRGPASPSWGGPMFLLPTPAPLPHQGSPGSQLLLAIPLFHLDQLQFLSMLLPLKPAISPSLAAFKLFILYLWFGALRKILIFYLSPFTRSEVGREGNLCALGCQWSGKGGVISRHCPCVGLSCQCAHLSVLHPEEMYCPTSM